MAKQYIYPAINPIWMNPVTTFNPDYNNLPFDFQPPQKPYTQKYQTGDTVKLQVLSDWVPTLKIYNNKTGVLVDTIAGSTPTTGIIDQTFTVYEFQIIWASYPSDVYFIQITYTDDDATLQINQSGLIQTQATFSQTVLVQYNNSYNAFSAIFSTGIIFNLRVEANIEDFTPGFEDVIYNDQEYNATKLNAIPYREFNFYAGSNRGSAGIPPWMADKLNWAFACDQLMLDGQYYQNTKGSKWEVMRADQLSPNFIGLKIAIIEVNNLFLEQYEVGGLPPGAIQVITNALKYTGISADLTIPGIFTEYSLLTRIVIYNLGNDIFTLNASTAADGSAPITTAFTTSGQLKEVWDIGELFDGVSTLYLLGLAGTNCNIIVEYDQLDAPAIAPIVTPKKFAKGTLYMYEEVTIGDFTTDWNIGTGAGNPGTDYEGCVISGTNGTLDRNGLLDIGWDPSLPLTRDMLVGNVGNEIVQTADQVGEHSHLMFNGSISNIDLTGDTPVAFQKNSDIKRDYVMSTSGLTPDRGKTSILNPSGPQPMNIANRSRVTLKFVCITN
jgi:hypothetical protein